MQKGQTPCSFINGDCPPPPPQHTHSVPYRCLSFRARHEAARIFYFDNSPDIEIQKAERLYAVAQDHTLAATAEELLEAAGPKDHVPYAAPPCVPCINRLC